MNCFANNKILSSDWCPRRCLRPPHFPRQLSSPLNAPLIRLRPFSPFLIKKSSPSLAMATLGDLSVKEMPLGVDPTVEEEYASQSKLLREFTDIPIIEKAWIFKSDEDNASQAMFSISQSNLLANKKRTHILSSHISTKSNDSVSFQWAPFPIDITGASAMVPSPSGSKLLVIKNQENESPTLFEIWGPSQLQKEIHAPKSVHGSVFADGWFEGISWDSSETLIAYVAEEPCPAKPAFDDLGYLKEGSTAKKDCGSWKGQGDWEEDWGETYSGKRQPALFVIDVVSGGVHGVKGISKSLSVGQVIWAPTAKRSHRYLVFVGWSLDFGSQKAVRKLGIKYCYNRPCALYAVKVPFAESGVDVQKEKSDSTEDLAAVVKLTEGISSAFFPRFSPDGHSLVFLSARTAVDTGAHWATNSLHRIDWPTDGNPQSAITIADVVPVVMCAEDGCFPGLYCSNFISEPWLSDGQTMIFSSFWRSTQVILSVDVLSGSVARISPGDSLSSWDVLALDGDKILSVSSSPIEPPQIKYGIPSAHTSVQSHLWNWFDVPNPITNSEKVCSLLASLQFSVLKIPIGEAPKNLTKGAKQPYEAIFVSSKSMKTGACDPLVVMLHGGPHSVSLTSFSKSLAFLSSLGYSLLIVNYRGSLGFGEEALQSLPGKIGLQDVNDVLKAIGHVVEMGLADSSKVAVLGGSHGGFLTTHLIGQAPDQFCAAAARNPVCNLELMVGTTDIPDWCYTEVYGSEGKDYFTEAPSSEHLHLFYDKSPISHITKVKTPTIFLLGAQDLRVPVSNGLQYARALKEKGVDVKVIVFPNDVHGISRPQSDFESFLNIGVWFKKYLK